MKNKLRTISPVLIIGSLQAEDTASLISKLVLVAREEQATLQECVELLRLVSALQVIIDSSDVSFVD